jgi:hypothetical protein
VTELTQADLYKEAQLFAQAVSVVHEPSLFGVDNGKAVGTYLESQFIVHLGQQYSFLRGNAAKGIDLPSVNVDIKTTSISQPQSSCPFRSARQKIFGLGYSLLLFVYEKTDDQVRRSANLSILHAIFIDETRTADYTLTRMLKASLRPDCFDDGSKLAT